MAIFNQEAQAYYKILYDECEVVDGEAYVKFLVYQTPADRDKEKAREADFARILGEVERIEQDAESSIYAIYAQVGEVSTQEQHEALYRMSEAYRKQCDLLERMGEARQKLPEVFYRYITVPPRFTLSDETAAALHIPAEYLSDPICVSTGCKICCGKVGDGPVTHATYYRLLKAELPVTWLDC